MRLPFTVAFAITLLASTPGAVACRAVNPAPNEEQLEKLPVGHVGVVGKVTRSYFSDQTKSQGEAVVLVEVQKSFGKDASAVGEHIYVLQPGCCRCEFISVNPDDIVHAGLIGYRGSPFNLSWPRQ